MTSVKLINHSSSTADWNDLLIASRDILLISQMGTCHVIVYKVSGTEGHPKTLVIVPFLP